MAARAPSSRPEMVAPEGTIYVGAESANDSKNEPFAIGPDRHPVFGFPSCRRIGIGRLAFEADGTTIVNEGSEVVARSGAATLWMWTPPSGWTVGYTIPTWVSGVRVASAQTVRSRMVGRPDRAKRATVALV